MPGKSNKYAYAMKSPYPMKASAEEKSAAKDKAIKGGMPQNVADKVFKMKDKHSFTPNTVNKMKAFGDTVYSMEVNGLMDPNKKNQINIGDTGNFNNEFMEVASIDNIANLRTRTYDDMRAEGYSEEEIQKAIDYNDKRFGNQNPTAAGLTNNTTVDSYNKIVGLKSIPQPGASEVKGDAFTSYDKRQRARGIKFEENLISRKDKKGKRLGEVIGKLEGKESLNKRQQRRLANLKSRQEKNTRIKDRLENVNKISQKQENQAINPKFYGQGKVTLQAGSPSSSTTPSKAGELNFIPTSKLSFKTYGMKKPFMMKKAYGMYKSKK